MKTKLIGIGVVVAAFFLAVPSAAPKGRPGGGGAGTPLAAVCGSPVGGESSCTLTATGLSSTEYELVVSSSCGVDYSGVPAFSTYESTYYVGCGAASITFDVYTVGRKGGLGSLVSTATANIP